MRLLKTLCAIIIFHLPSDSSITIRHIIYTELRNVMTIKYINLLLIRSKSNFYFSYFGLLSVRAYHIKTLWLALFKICGVRSSEIWCRWILFAYLVIKRKSFMDLPCCSLNDVSFLPVWESWTNLQTYKKISTVNEIGVKVGADTRSSDIQHH